MSFYNMLFGMNAQADLLLAVIGLRQNDIERFRDVHVSEDGKVIEVYTRTGGGNREGYPNLSMRKRPEWNGSADDDFDSTYCTDLFNVPVEWQEDVRALSDIFGNGIRKEFGQHLLKTLRREPTEGDKSTDAYNAEHAALKRLPHFLANGHTFVPHNDYAMEEALKLAEANNGVLRCCWGIAPIKITVQQNIIEWPNAKPPMNERLERIKIGYDYKWQMDMEYWQHCEKRFASTYPLTMANIRKTVAQHESSKAA